MQKRVILDLFGCASLGASNLQDHPGRLLGYHAFSGTRARKPFSSCAPSVELHLNRKDAGT